MHVHWTLIIAIGLILLKQIYKLFLYHKPDRVDYLKALADLPFDISFLIVSLFLKAAGANGGSDHFVGLLVAYLLASTISAFLWRVSVNGLKVKLGFAFALAFPFNLAWSSTALYLALEYVG
jgi:hypothetical protein